MRRSWVTAASELVHDAKGAALKFGKFGENAATVSAGHGRGEGGWGRGWSFNNFTRRKCTSDF